MLIKQKEEELNHIKTKNGNKSLYNNYNNINKDYIKESISSSANADIITYKIKNDKNINQINNEFYNKKKSGDNISNPTHPQE